MRSLRAATLVGAALLVLLGTPPAWGGGGTGEAPPAPPAEASSPAQAPSAPPTPAPLQPEDLEGALFGTPLLHALRLALQLVPALVGVALLVAGYRTFSRRRAGLLPPRPPRPPPTRPFDLLPALGLFLGLYTVVGVGVVVLVRAEPALEHSLAFAYGSMFVLTVPLAGLVLLMRRLQGARAQRGGWSVLRSGLVAFSLGTAVALPLAILGGVLLHALGRPPSVYEVIERAVDPARPENLWLTALFAVFVAPFAEEAIFRGMLHPAIRAAAGGGRRGFWVAAIVVAALFAAFHGHAPSFLPLFGLAIVLAFVFDATDSLAPVMLGHAFFNAATVVPLVVARLQGQV